MGVVYRARDDRLQRTVALKLLSPITGADPAARDRFLAEARAASAIDHPNIGTVFDIGETDSGDSFIAMAYYDGRTLKDHIADARLSLDEAIGIAIQIAEGLAAAHARDIVHRDVKPANILLTSTGVAKLVDFGLAKMAGIDLTVTNQTLGTVAYMSPEQTKGEPVDKRTDVWALGVILYEMLAGRRPFPGDYQQAVIYGILNEDPDMTPLEAFDPAVAKVVEKALSKSKDERFEDGAAFAAALRALQAGKGESAVEAAIPERTDSPVRARPQMEKTLLIAAAVAFVFASALVTYLVLRRPSATPASESSIAVLPFANLSRNPDDQYISDGLTEELLNALGKVEGLHVPSRTSVFAFQGRDVDIRSIGDRLNVDHALEGSVRKSGNQVRVRATLSNTRTGEQMWSQTYQQEMNDLFQLQESIAGEIVENLREQFSLGVRHIVAAPDPESYDLYLKGRFFLNKRNAPALAKARSCFRDAIRLDSTYAKSWAGLADALALTGSYGILPPADVYPAARKTALKALELDPNLADAHTTLALIDKSYYWDWEKSREHFEKAVQLEPNNANAHHQYSVEYLSVMGLHDEAIREGELAADLDPLSPIVNADLGRVYYSARMPEKAVVQLKKTLELSPEFFMAHLYLGIAYLMESEFDLALKEFGDAQKFSGDSLGPNPNSVTYTAVTYAMAGRTREARETLEELDELAKRKYVAPYWFGLIYGRLGEWDTAFSWMDRALEDRNLHLIYLKDAPLTDIFRNDPRTKEILAKMGLRSS